ALATFREALAGRRTLGTNRPHLAELLTRLGQLDLARGDLAAAAAELAEAQAIGVEPAHIRYASGLYASYFLSLALERQGRWSDAGALWQAAVAAREPGALGYWNAMKEQAACYARAGDLARAAAIARQVVAGAAGKRLAPELPAPHPL